MIHIGGSQPEYPLCPSYRYSCRWREHTRATISGRKMTPKAAEEAGVRRRDFIAFVVASTAWPTRARAQEPGRIYRVGGLSPSPRDSPHYVAFFDEVQRLGFIEGQNLDVDGRGYGASIDQFPAIAGELAKAKTDAIFCAGDVAIR